MKQGWDHWVTLHLSFCYKISWGKKRLNTDNAASLVQNKNKIRNPILRAGPNRFLEKRAPQGRRDSIYLPDLGLKVLE